MNSNHRSQFVSRGDSEIQFPASRPSIDKGFRFRARRSAGIFRSCLGFATGLLLALCFCGCVGYYPKDFTAKRGMSCDEVRITGDFHYIGKLDGVWFNGVKATASFRRFPPPAGPHEILAIVPPQATSGPIRVKISPGTGILLGILGTDYTFAEDFIVTGSPAAPTVESFTPSATSYKPSDAPIVLNWTTTGTVTGFKLKAGSAAALSFPAGTTSTTVTPGATTTYSLVAENKCIESSAKEVTIEFVPPPHISSLNKSSYHAGESLTASGSALTRTGEVSSLVFTQTGSTPIQAPLLSSTASALKADIPAGLSRGQVSVHALVGSESSNAKDFAFDTRTNGFFVEITSSINMSSPKTCGGKSLVIGTNPLPPPPKLAVFTKGATTLGQSPIQEGALGGATFSPGCTSGVFLTYNKPPADNYTFVVQRFEQPVGTKAFDLKPLLMGGALSISPKDRWHVLFSPDDTIVLVSFTAQSLNAEMAVLLWDTVKQAQIGPALPIPTQSNYNDLKAEVRNGNTIRVTVGTFMSDVPIF